MENAGNLAFNLVAEQNRGDASVKGQMTGGCITGENVRDSSLAVAVTKAYARAKSGNSYQLPDSAPMGHICEWPIFYAQLPVARFDVRGVLELGESFRCGSYELLVVGAYRLFKSLLDLEP